MEDDRRLVTRAQQGDPNAFAELYDRYLDAIYRYILLRTNTQEQAEDLSEEVFLKAWQGLRNYRPERPFLHWLYRIAHNTVVDDHRRKRGQTLSLDALDEAGRQFASAAPSPLQHAIRREAYRDLGQALATMSPDEQTLLVLRFTEALPFDAIADILGKSAGACRVLQHRALKKLAKKMNDHQRLSDS